MNVKKRQSIENALLISGSYLVFGMLWIYFSDSAVELLAFADPHRRLVPETSLPMGIEVI